MYSIKYINSCDRKQKYKRIIWLGLRNTKPNSLSNLHPSNIEISKTIEQEIINPSYREKKPPRDILPILTIWENSKGELSYGEII